MTTIFAPFWQQRIKVQPNLDGSFSPAISQFTEFYFEVTKGEIPGHEGEVIRGHNPSQSAASGFVDVAEFGDLEYLSSAERLNISSTDINDTLLGTGLRTLLVKGVDNDGVEIQELISMDGTSNVLTEKSYLRDNFLLGLAVGSGEENLGVVTAVAETAGTTQQQMGIADGISHGGQYTVPKGKSFFLITLEMNAARTIGAQPIVEFKFFAREGGAGQTWRRSLGKKIDTAAIDELDIVLPFPSKLPERTDMRFACNTDKNDTEIEIRYCGILVDNEITLE